MRKQFKDTVFSLAKTDERVVVVLGDITVFQFRDYQAQFPTRFYNMGICEQALISVGAGLRSQGLIPFVHTIGAFLMERAMEQIKDDLIYNHYPANLVSCAGTFDYAWDGPTHHAWVDVAFMRLLPGTQIFQPGTRKEVDFLMRQHYAEDVTNFFRLSEYVHPFDFPLEPRKGVVVRRGTDKAVTVVTGGPVVEDVVKACEGLDVNILYFHTLKPLDQELIGQFAHTPIKVVHDTFGLFETICEITGRSVSRLTPHRFAQTYGTIQDVRRDAGLGVEAIREFVRG